MRTISVGMGLLIGSYAGPLLSHHGNLEFDLSVVVKYEGVVTEHFWKNPHTLTILETRNESGEPIILEIEGGSPSISRTAGVTGDMIVPGDHVIALVSPSRRFPNESAFGREIIKDDGSIVPLNERYARETPPTSQSASDIFGTWSATREAFSHLGQSRTSWELTEEGQAIFDNYSPVMSSQAQCLPVSAPWLMVYPVVFEFERLSDRISIRTDWMGAERTVYLDGRGHPPNDETFRQGHSIGRWEDDVLVVDTTNFTDDEFYIGIASGEEKHLVERFSLSEGGKSMTYAFVLEDPEYLREQVSGTYQMPYRPDLELSGIECDLPLAERFFREFRDGER